MLSHAIRSSPYFIRTRQKQIYEFLLSKCYIWWLMMIYIFRLDCIYTDRNEYSHKIDQWKFERNIPNDELLIGIEIWLESGSNNFYEFAIQFFLIIFGMAINYLRLAFSLSIYLSSRDIDNYHPHRHDATSLPRYRPVLAYYVYDTQHMNDRLTEYLLF